MLRFSLLLVELVPALWKARFTGISGKCFSRYTFGNLFLFYYSVLLRPTVNRAFSRFFIENTAYHVFLIFWLVLGSSLDSIHLERAQFESIEFSIESPQTI